MAAHGTSRRELTTLFAEIPLFARCTKRSLATIARHVETVTVEAGKTIVKEGAAGDAFFVLLDGEAAIETAGRPTGTLEPGSYFGELALLSGSPRSATVRATTEVTVAVLGARMFRTLVREYADLAEQLLAGLAGELRDAYARIRALEER
jgi:CRP-like cAMP-binding protein